MEPIQHMADEMEKVGAPLDEPTELAKAAVKIATGCLMTMRGELLRKALEVARAVVEFDVELHHPGTD